MQRHSGRFEFNFSFLHYSPFRRHQQFLLRFKLHVLCTFIAAMLSQCFNNLIVFLVVSVTTLFSHFFLIVLIRFGQFYLS